MISELKFEIYEKIDTKQPFKKISLNSINLNSGFLRDKTMDHGP